MESMDVAIEGGYLNAPDIVALCKASRPSRITQQL